MNDFLKVLLNIRSLHEQLSNDLPFEQLEELKKFDTVVRSS